MTSQAYNVKGMHCASCAAIITKKLSKVDGITEVNVNLATETARVVFEGNSLTPEALNDIVNKYGYSLELEQPFAAIAAVAPDTATKREEKEREHGEKNSNHECNLLRFSHS